MQTTSEIVDRPDLGGTVTVTAGRAGTVSVSWWDGSTTTDVQHWGIIYRDTTRPTSQEWTLVPSSDGCLLSSSLHPTKASALFALGKAWKP